MHTLYKLTFLSGKSYIGQTVRTMQTRMAQHRRSAMNGGSQLPVHCAWRKHGAPIVDVIGEYESPAGLHEAEIEAICSHGTLAPSGYNVTDGGDTAPSKSRSVAAKISAKAMGRKHSEETITCISGNSKKMWESEEYRGKVSAGLKASWTEEMRKAAGDRSKARWDKRKSEGWTMPDSQRQKLNGRVFSDEARKHMSDAAKGKPKAPRSEKTKAKLSASTKSAWQDKELSSRRVSSIKAAWTEDARAGMAKKAAATWSDPVIRERRITAIREALARKKLNSSILEK